VYWRVMARDEKWSPIEGIIGQVKVVNYETDERFVRKRSQFTCFVEAQDELEAEAVAMTVFEQITKAMILASGISYHPQMEWPSEVDPNETDATILIRRDSVAKTHRSYLVKPLREYTFPLFSIERVVRWLGVVQQLDDPWAARLIDLYCRGVRLRDISEGAGYIEFIKVVEFFINKKYRQMFEKERAQELTDASPKKLAFENELRDTVRRHFPQAENSQVKEFVGETLTQANRKLLFSYSNRGLLEYLCRQSGFYDHILDKRKKGLETSIDDTYSYWPEEKRKQHAEELYREHEKFILTVSKDLFGVRATVAAHLAKDRGVEEYDAADMGAFSICALLALYLITRLVEGAIQLD